MKTHLVLQKYIRRKKASAKGFSAKELAHELGLSPSFLSRVLNGKKPIPFPLLLKLRDTLGIEPEVFANLKEAHLVEVNSSKAPRRGAADVRMPLEDWELAPEQSERILRHWYYIAILDLTSLADFDGSAQMVAQKLGLSLTTAEVALRELGSLGLIEIRDGRITKKMRKLRFSSATPSQEIRRFHSLMLERAQLELKHATSAGDVARRLITGITVTASADQIERAKEKLANCLHEIANDLIAGESTDIYHLSAQLFPLTK